MERHGTTSRKTAFFLSRAEVDLCGSIYAVPLRKKQRERHGGA